MIKCIGSCNNQTGAEKVSLPFSCEKEFGIRSDFEEMSTRHGPPTSLFPSPLTCPSIDDMAYMDEDNQVIRSSENEPDYEEIGSFMFLA